MTYSEKLKDPRWQKKRLEILNRDSFMCRNCGSNSNQLHIHHIAYFNKPPWEIDNDLLITLCISCHIQEQEEVKESHHDFITILKQSGFMSSDFKKISCFILKNGTDDILRLCHLESNN